MIRVRLPVPVKIGDGPFCDWVDRGHEALYSNEGRLQAVVDKDGHPPFHQWASQGGTRGVSMSTSVEDRGREFASVGMVFLPELGMVVPECLFCAAPEGLKIDSLPDRMP